MLVGLDLNAQVLLIVIKNVTTKIYWHSNSSAFLIPEFDVSCSSQSTEMN